VAQPAPYYPSCNPLRNGKSFSTRRLPILAARFACTSAYAITIGGGVSDGVDLSQTFDLSADRASSAKTYRNRPASRASSVAIASFCVGAVYGKGVSGSSGGTMSFSKIGGQRLPRRTARG
jgi:hypothetical protein